MIQCAVVGAGVVAQQHLACVSQLPGVRLAAVCDLSRSLAECAAERYGAGAWFTDYRRMLEALRPDIVHVTTPAASHFGIARDCLQAGAHVFVEKPATRDFAELASLQALAEASRRWLIEDYNYVYNAPVRRMLESARNGALGEIVHVEVVLCLDVLAKGNPFADVNLRHPALELEGGVIADFLPHLASLAYFACGPVRGVRTVWAKRDAASTLPHDEFRALLHGSRATATLAFSAHSQPDLFRLTLFGTKARASADIYENRLSWAALRPAARPLVPFYNALDEARTLRRSAWKLLWRKLGGGPGAYDGLWTLIRQVYDSMAAGGPPPLAPADVLAVNRLVAELKSEGNRI
jgi:predicted dehydrogenase